MTLSKWKSITLFYLTAPSQNGTMKPLLHRVGIHPHGPRATVAMCKGLAEAVHTISRSLCGLLCLSPSITISQSQELRHIHSVPLSQPPLISSLQSFSSTLLSSELVSLHVSPGGKINTGYGRFQTGVILRAGNALGNFNLKLSQRFRDVLVRVMHKGTVLMDMSSRRHSTVHYDRERGHGRE